MTSSQKGKSKNLVHSSWKTKRLVRKQLGWCQEDAIQRGLWPDGSLELGKRLPKLWPSEVKEKKKCSNFLMVPWKRCETSIQGGGCVNLYPTEWYSKKKLYGKAFGGDSEKNKIDKQLNPWNDRDRISRSPCGSGKQNAQKSCKKENYRTQSVQEMTKDDYSNVAPKKCVDCWVNSCVWTLMPRKINWKCWIGY